MQRTQVTINCVCGRKLTKTIYGSSTSTIRCPRCGSAFKVK